MATETEKRDENLWIFNSGNFFDGNPKYLFLYITMHHKEIKCVWLCYGKTLLRKMRSLGFTAYLYSDKRAVRIQARAGVYVVNQQKEIFDEALAGIKVLNLWHGVGCKTVELGVDGGMLHERIIKKNIRHCAMYQQNQLFLVTSPMMEEHFRKSMNLPASAIIRGGYPCVMFSDDFRSYDHDILRKKGLPEGTRVVLYAPTYRDYNRDHFFSKALPDMDALIKCAEENGLLIVLKMHPQMDNDFEYRQAREKYLSCQRLLFWDNEDDFYEIMDKTDTAIIDYSSIFYDLVASGIKKFIRYTFDQQQQQTRSFAFDFTAYTCGPVCDDFESLLAALSHDLPDMSADVGRIYKTFWEYSSSGSFERIIGDVRAFEPCAAPLPNLYSFDIFDTLIARTTLQPRGIFFYVREKMMQDPLTFPHYLTQAYVRLRMQAESNCREFFNKTLDKRTFTEISLDMIFERMRTVYSLTDEQTAKMKEWELEAEYRSSIPVRENIAAVLELLEAGEKVILISDMYLSEDFIKKLLLKAEPALAELPLYLSSELGGQKTKKKLYIQAFMDQDYRYASWIHTGDNAFADIKQARSLGIQTNKVNVPGFTKYENRLAELCPTYDSFQTAGLLARFRKEHVGESESIFAYCYASLYFVPYVDFCVRDAAERGIRTLYFIARDGHHLKSIADTIIKKKNYPLRTKYIYGSRKAWRIPSQTYAVDDDFFGPFGNFTGANTVHAILDAAALSDEEFAAIFPQLAHFLGTKTLTGAERNGIITALKNSEKYKELLLEKAKKLREAAAGYLTQEIDFSEQFAFVEFWGRGYTQTCLARILNDICRCVRPVPFYYFRTIYPSENLEKDGFLERVNFTVANYSLLFIESIFANLPYSTTTGYEMRQGRWEPVYRKNRYKESLFTALEQQLVQFTEDWCSLDFLDAEQSGRMLADFSVRYFSENPTERIFIEQVADLLDAVELNGIEQEFAPRITVRRVAAHILGRKFRTKNFKMSFARSGKFIRFWHKKVKKHKTLRKLWLSMQKAFRKHRR